MEETDKLYLVELQGMKTSHTGAPYGSVYVIAKDPTEAYNKVYAFLYQNDLGFRDKRELDSVTLLAENARYTSAPKYLFK